MKYKFICSKCGSIITKEPAYKCNLCGGILELQYEMSSKEFFPIKESSTIYKYADLLPIHTDRSITLGEGNTPLVQSNGKLLRGFKDLYFKLEGLNPTGSFKDRGIAVSVTKAEELSIDTLIIASSGNASASAAAYAARSGKRLIAVVPESTPIGKINQALTYGATIVKVPGNFSNSYKLCMDIANRYHWLNLTTTYMNPYATEGYKTIGFEIFDQLKYVPNWIVVPVGAGPILSAIKNAFEDLKRLKIVKDIPRLVCVQSENCGPISEAYLNGYDKVKGISKPKTTMASGIDDALLGYTEDGDYTIDNIKQTNGTAVTLNEDEILESVLMMGKEGIYAEPAGGVGLIATMKLFNEDLIKKDESVVVVVTGNGLKNPIPIANRELPVIRSVNDFEDFYRDME